MLLIILAFIPEVCILIPIVQVRKLSSFRWSGQVTCLNGKGRLIFKSVLIPLIYISLLAQKFQRGTGSG